MSTAVATHERTEPRSVLVSMSNRFGMEPAAFEATLRATVVPKEVSREQFAAFLLVAKEYGLNPLTKEIYAFPTRGGGIQPIVGVDGWANLINSNKACDGFEFVDNMNDKGEIVSITCRIYRKDRSHAVEATEYMAECKRNTDTWKQWPRRMLRHKALIQAARYAFGFSGIIDPDEWERHPENVEGASIERHPARKANVVQVVSNGAKKDLPPVVGNNDDAATKTESAADETDQPADMTADPTDNSSQIEDAEVVDSDAPPLPDDLDAWMEDICTRMRAAESLQLLNEIRQIEVGPYYQLLPQDHFDEIENTYSECIGNFVDAEPSAPESKGIDSTYLEAIKEADKVLAKCKTAKEIDAIARNLQTKLNGAPAAAAKIAKELFAMHRERVPRK